MSIEIIVTTAPDGFPAHALTTRKTVVEVLTKIEDIWDDQLKTVLETVIAEQSSLDSSIYFDYENNGLWVKPHQSDIAEVISVQLPKSFQLQELFIDQRPVLTWEEIQQKLQHYPDLMTTQLPLLGGITHQQEWLTREETTRDLLTVGRQATTGDAIAANIHLVLSANEQSVDPVLCRYITTREQAEASFAGAYDTIRNPLRQYQQYCDLLGLSPIYLSGFDSQCKHYGLIYTLLVKASKDSSVISTITGFCYVAETCNRVVH